MDSFNVGEVVWAKLRGYPWWPAIGTEDDNKEKKYVVSFIGDNTHANLQKKYLNKFQKEYKTHSNTKKKDLLSIIRKAKDIHDNKMRNEEQNKTKGKKDVNVKKYNNNNGTVIDREVVDVNIIQVNESSSKQKMKEEKASEGSYITNSNNIEKKEKTQIMNMNSNSKINERIKESKEIGQTYLKKKTKRKEEKNAIDLINKIISYLNYIVKILYRKNGDKIKEDKECIIKVMNFLKDYKMVEPIDFLKKTNLGKLAKYINIHIDEKEIKEISGVVMKNFEEQVLNQLFRKTK